MKKTQNLRLRFAQYSKILIGIMIILAGITLVSAYMQKDFNPDINTISLTNVNSFMGIRLPDFLGGGDTQIADYTLTANTPYCSYCYAEGNATLYVDGTLFDNLYFTDINGNNINIQSSNVYLLSTYESPIYQTQCNNFEETNGTISNINCHPVQIGTTIKVNESSKELYSGDTLPAGDYYWRIEGKKDATATVDWIASSNGVDLTEWTIWGPTVVLDFPANNIVINPFTTQTFNCTAFTTGSLDLNNVSLWLDNNLNQSISNFIANVNETNGIPYDALSPRLALKYGEEINVKSDGLQILSISKDSLSDVSTAYLANESFYLIANATFLGPNGNTATFLVPQNLTNGANYWILADKFGSGQDVHRLTGGGVTYPYVGTFVDWVAGVDIGVATNIAYIITSIEIQKNLQNYTASFNIPINDIGRSLNWTCQACDNNDTCNFANETRTIKTNNFVENSQTFNPVTTLGSSESFSINFSYDNVAYNGVTANLIYNLTSHSGTASGGMPVIYNSVITVPSVLTPTIEPFYWQLILSNSTGVLMLNSTFHNQTVNSLSVDNCSVGSVKIMNLAIVDEDNFAAINGTIETTVKIYSLNTDNLIAVYNASLIYSTSHPLSICISNLSSAGYSMFYSMKYYGNTTYYQQYKEAQNSIISLSTIPQNITLYDLQVASGFPFQITIRGSNSADNSNLLVDVQRQYLALNSFISVQSSVTDTNGEMSANLVQNSVVYTFVISQNGVVLGSFNNYQVKCDNQAVGTCSITLNLAQATSTAPNFADFGNISGSYVLDNPNRNLFFTFSSADGNVHSVEQLVQSNNGYGNTTICDNTISGTSGSFTCNIASSYGNITYISTIYSDNALVGTNFFSFSPSSSIFYGTRTILMLLLYSSLVMLFISNPITIVIGSIVGILMGMFLVIMDGGAGVGVIIWFVLAGVILIWQIGRRFF